MAKVLVCGAFDDLRYEQVRFLDAAARLGKVHVSLWSDAATERFCDAAAKFSEAERRYLLESLRYVSHLSLCNDVDPERPTRLQAEPFDILAVSESDDTAAKRYFCRQCGVEYRVLRRNEIDAMPDIDPPCEPSSQPIVMATGCYDWFHSGHVRFFDEVSQLGDLYVVVGHDANIRLLKGEGHPLFPERQRRYLVQAVRSVRRALISTGHGWLDAEPELERFHPAIYAVNEDGDRPEKREYCERHGIEYRVLKRTPKEGLPRRNSTNLRGF